jgi:O-antigen/teichoic acid export membrane protein
MIGIVAVSLFSYEIIKVLAGSKEFWGAVVVIPLLALSIFFVNMKEVTVYGLHIAKKTRIIGIIVVFTTIMSLLLNILFIPMWDITGAAVATLLSQFIYWYACYYFSQKVYYVPYEIKKILTMLVTGAVLSFSSLLINKLGLFPRMVIKTACLVSFPFILYLFNFYEAVELQSIKGFFNKWLKFRNLKSNLKSLRGMTDSEF